LRAADSRGPGTAQCYRADPSRIPALIPNTVTK
jgi:hypothetical protein